MNELPPLLLNPTFVAIFSIVLSILSIGMSVTIIILTKKTKERDDARIAMEEATAAQASAQE